MNYPALVRNPSFFVFLLQLDLTIVESTRSAGCPFCGGSLDRSDWKRKGFGIPDSCSEEVLVRHSFQCRSCKRRTTPNSLRWMYYRWYSGCIELLVTALVARDCKTAVTQLCQTFHVEPDLIRKWRKWWSQVFQSGPFWQQHLSRFDFISYNTIPNGLLTWFEDSGRPKGLLRNLVLLVEFSSRYRTYGRWRRAKDAIEKGWTNAIYHLQLA